MKIKYLKQHEMKCDLCMHVDYLTVRVSRMPHNMCAIAYLRLNMSLN